MAAHTINQVTFGGNVVADGEIRYTQDGRPISRFRMAVSNRAKIDGEWKDDTLWVSVTCFGRTAERHNERPLLKGHRVVITGRLETPKIYHGQKGDGIAVNVIANDVARFDFPESGDDTGDLPDEDAMPVAARSGGVSRSAPKQAEPDALDDLPF